MGEKSARPRSPSPHSPKLNSSIECLYRVETLHLSSPPPPQVQSTAAEVGETRERSLRVIFPFLNECAKKGSRVLGEDHYSELRHSV